MLGAAYGMEQEWLRVVDFLVLLGFKQAQISLLADVLGSLLTTDDPLNRMDKRIPMFQVQGIDAHCVVSIYKDGLKSALKITTQAHCNTTFR